jgi:hypothetical protein
LVRNYAWVNKIIEYRLGHVQKKLIIYMLLSQKYKIMIFIQFIKINPTRVADPSITLCNFLLEIKTMYQVLHCFVHIDQKKLYFVERNHQDNTKRQSNIYARE